MKDTNTASRAVSYFHHWLAPPLFDDEDKTRIAGIFNTLILTLVALWLGVLTTQIALGMQNPRNVLVGLVTCTLSLGIREIARKEQVSLAIVLFCALLLLSFSLGVYNAGTVRATGITVMTICVIVPTLLLGWRMGFAFLVLTSASLFVLSRAEIAGMLPSMITASLDPTSQWIVFTATILFHLVLVSTARNSMLEALTRVRKENAARQGVEENLHELNVSLEKRVTEHTAELHREILERKQVEETLRESEERLRFVMLATQDAVYDCDIHSGNVFRNEAYQALFSPYEPVGTDETWWENQLYPDDRQRVMESISNTIQERKQTWSGEYRFRRFDGSYASVIDRGYIIYDSNGQPIRMVGALIDFTERKLAEEKLRESEERYRDLVEVCPSAILVQSERRIVFVNPAAFKLLGAAHSGQLIGKSIWEIIHPDHQALAREYNQQMMDNQRIPPEEGKFIRVDQSVVDVEVIATPLVYQNHLAIQIIAQDITERKQAEESIRDSHIQLQAQFSEIEKLQIELHEQATHDQLTGLYNRFYLFDALTQEVPRAIRGNYPISIILLDIDHFKIINDSFGHDAGDETLRVLASQLKTLSRAEDILCRYGGDEHLIVMHNTPAHIAVERAEQLRKAITEARVNHAGKTFEFTSSFGIAVFQDYGKTIEEVISVADRALYQSKQKGRNCVTLL